MTDESGESRRRFLHLTGVTAMAALAGCGGNGAEPTETETGQPTAEPVPAAYRTATSQGGDERSPDGLSTKEAVQYQEQPNEGQQCSGCRFYIPDKNDDGMGACAIVEGLISPEGWCISYAAFQEGTATTTS